MKKFVLILLSLVTVIVASSCEFFSGNSSDSSQSQKESSSNSSNVSVSMKVNDTILLIDLLPEATAVSAEHGGKIVYVKSEFEKLTEDEKAQVTNADKLQAVIEAWGSKYVLLEGMEFTPHSAYLKEDQVEFMEGFDEEFGAYLNAKFMGMSQGEYHLALQYTLEDMETKLAGCDKVVFYVWNDNSVREYERWLMCNFGGSLKTQYCRIPVQEWTRVEVSATDFLSGKYFGILNAGFAVLNCDYKFTTPVGVKAQA